MDTARWRELQRLFQDALARPAGERTAFLDRACAGDPSLRAEVERLLGRDAGDDETIRRAIGQAASRVSAQVAGDRAAARVGERLGAWRLTAHLADGGMGAVYRAARDDGQYAQRAAVKLINPAYVAPQAKARLQAERQILARLAHPHIARLLDGGETADGVPYLVMEFVDGEPIDRWCDRHALSTAQRLRLFVRVCRAVEHAHRNLVVHRDLKPSNILVDTQGEPRLLDFGIAKLIDGADGVTRSGERVLTPSHASPEQVTGASVTTATDVYALGVLLYDLLAGRSPYGADAAHPVELARRIVETVPPRPSSAVGDGSSRRLAAARERGERLTAERLARELDGDLDNIALMALRKEPERRYASAAALADDIERCLAHRPVHARADTPAYRAAKFLRRHPVAVPASALALALAVGGSGLFTLRLAGERDRARAAEMQARQAASFTASVLENTGANRDAAREVSVQTLLEQAAGRIDAELAAEPAVATRMRIAVGSAFHSWGAYDEALSQLEAALAEARARGPAGGRDAAEALQLLGTVTHDLGQLEASLDWTRQAEALWRRVGSPAEHAGALGDVAMSLNALRRRSEAEPVFRAALARMREAHGGDHDDIAWLLNNLAWGLHAMGRLDEAAPLYGEALAMQRRLGAALTDLSQTQNNLAGLHYDRGDLDTAERLWKEVLAQYESVFGRGGHAAVARGQAMVALVAIDRGHIDEALRLSAEALATNTALLGERHRWTAGAMQRHGIAQLLAGRHDDAEHWLRRADALQRELLPAAHAAHVSVRLGLARVALARGGPGDAARAEDEARAALLTIAALPSPDRVPRDAVELALARALALQGRRAEARGHADAALARMQASLAPTHWRRLRAEAAVGLPPFVAVPLPESVARAREALAQLREQVGEDAPAVHEIEAALAAAGSTAVRR